MERQCLVCVCERERERWREREKEGKRGKTESFLEEEIKTPPEGVVLLLIHCMPVEKGSPAGFVSSVLKKSLLSEAFSALNVRIGITAHTPEMPEADWWPLA